MYNYVKYSFSNLSAEARYAPENYNLLLYSNIFENRTEQTIENLYTILNNYIVERQTESSSCNPHLTQVRCVCLQKLGYVQEGAVDIAFKFVKDPEKIREHTMALFSYLLSYKQLYRLKYGASYDAYLQERLSKLRNFMFDSVFIGFDELVSNGYALKSIKESGYCNVSDFMRELYGNLNVGIIKRNTSSYSSVNIYCTHLTSYNLLPDLFVVRKCNIGYRYPYNLLLLLLSNNLSRLLPFYFKLKGTVYEDALNSYLFHYLTPREARVLFLRFKEHKTLHEVSKDFCVTADRITQIETKALRKLRSLMVRKHLGDVNVLYSELVIWQKEGHSISDLGLWSLC